MYSKSILNDIRDRVSIASIIGERVQLKRSGRNLKGLCPFHGEKTPSFMVSDDKQIYHCFGCAEGGDIFTFIMKFEGMEFSEAVKYLADRAGVELPKFTNDKERTKEEEKDKKKKQLFRVNEIAKDFFFSQLNDSAKGTPARQYLQLREIKGEISTQHFLGFADNEWDSLARHFERSNVPLPLAEELGLVRKRESGGYYDFFRGRLMFPIVSARGEIIGFGGRVIESDGKGDVAKYVNSPDSLIYNKSNSVYGLNVAAREIRTKNFVILVEGYMDLIALNQAGILNVVAPLGTALTEGHLGLLSRYTKNFVLIFDGDEAGFRAALRSLELFMQHRMMPRVVVLPAGEDPDTLVRKEGCESFLKRIKNARSLFEYFLDETLKSTGNDVVGRVETVGKVIPFLKMITDPVERGMYVRLTSTKLGVDEDDISRAVSGKVLKRVSNSLNAQGPKVEKTKQSRGESSAEKELVKAMLGHPEVVAKVFEKITPESFLDDSYRLAAEAIKRAVGEGRNKGAGDLLAEIEDPALAAKLRQLVVEDDGLDESDLNTLVDDCLKRINERIFKQRHDLINDEIKKAESARDEKKLFELLEEKKRISNEKHSIHKFPPTRG